MGGDLRDETLPLPLWTNELAAIRPSRARVGSALAGTDARTPFCELRNAALAVADRLIEPRPDHLTIAPRQLAPCILSLTMAERA